jgi:hypothetical protein
MIWRVRQAVAFLVLVTLGVTACLGLVRGGLLVWILSGN